MAISTTTRLAAPDSERTATPDRLVNVYVELSDAPYAYGHVLERGRVVDYAADGTPVGVEFVAVDGCASVATLPHADLIAEALRRNDILVCA
ncbi:MAG: DUF2283 domain-containing protein [Chloroflexota bacterium]|nr:DUF2283 domain-containing protein [Chloroflexota bacterium]